MVSLGTTTFPAGFFSFDVVPAFMTGAENRQREGSADHPLVLPSSIPKIILVVEV